MQVEVTFDEVIAYIEARLSNQNQLKLSRQEIAVLEAAWLDITYEEYASQKGKGLNAASLRANVVSSLWDRLTKALQPSQRFTKKKFALLMKLLINPSVENSYSARSTSIFLRDYPPVLEEIVGRQTELEELAILISSCKIVQLVGFPGIGKSTLASMAFHQLQNDFAYNIWIQIEKGDTFERICADIVKSVNPCLDKDIATQDDIRVFEEIITTYPLFIVLEDAYLLEDFDTAKGNVESFFKQWISVENKSLLLLVSREQSTILSNLEKARRPVRTFKLQGLNQTEGQTLLEKERCFGKTLANYVKTYNGNPQMLLKIAERINEFYLGDADKVSINITSLVSDHSKLALDELFTSKSLQANELKILQFLANCEGKAEVSALLEEFGSDIPSAEVLCAIGNLQSLSLVERIIEGSSQVSFTISRPLLRYIHYSFSMLNPQTIS
jgi:hypothetical protein